MIHYVSGDILLSRAQAIAHGVAPMDPMNQGLARSLHEKYPAMHKDYHHKIPVHVYSEFHAGQQDEPRA